MRCLFERQNDHWICAVCSNRVRVIAATESEPPVGICATEPGVPQPKGPGDYLHDAILRWVGESPTSDCQCRA